LVEVLSIDIEPAEYLWERVKRDSRQETGGKHGGTKKKTRVLVVQHPTPSRTGVILLYSFVSIQTAQVHTVCDRVVEYSLWELNACKRNNWVSVVSYIYGSGDGCC
jgi:hypothetical protein